MNLEKAETFLHTWYIPLNDEDIVIHQLHTRSTHRGKGIASAIVQYIIAYETYNGGEAYSDTSTRNKPSIRAHGRIGFRIIAKTKFLPLPSFDVSLERSDNG